MADSGYLAPPDKKPEQKELWDQTWKRLDRFLPALHGELFPETIGKGKGGQKTPARRSGEGPSIKEATSAPAPKEASPPAKGDSKEIEQGEQKKKPEH
jgi:brefeldin A-resistance guanine nucleotide exchange factor 1